MKQKTELNQVLFQIEGFKPFIICRFCTQRDYKTKERVFDHLDIREVIPLAVIQITSNMLQIAIDDCIENESELNSYDPDQECEIPIRFSRNQNLHDIWTKIEPQMMKCQEDFRQMETIEEVQEYLSDYLWDNCLDLLAQEPFQHHSNPITEEFCTCEDWPCCGHSR